MAGLRSYFSSRTSLVVPVDRQPFRLAWYALPAAGDPLVDVIMRVVDPDGTVLCFDQRTLSTIDQGQLLYMSTLYPLDAIARQKMRILVDRLDEVIEGDAFPSRAIPSRELPLLR